MIQIPAYDVREELATGCLIEVLPDHRADPLPMTVLYPHRRHLSHRLQVFIEWLHGLLQREVLADNPPARGRPHNTPHGDTPSRYQDTNDGRAIASAPEHHADKPPSSDAR